jgi:hypothetical protein
MYRSTVQPDLIHRRIIHHFDQFRDHRLVLAIPRSIAAPWCARTCCRFSDLLPGSGRVIFIQFREACKVSHFYKRPCIYVHACCPQRIDVRIAFSIFKSAWGRVVLDDEAVPVGHPHGTVRAHLRMYGGKPFVGTCQQIETVFLFVTLRLLVSAWPGTKAARSVRTRMRLHSSTISGSCGPCINYAPPLP